MQVIGAGLGRTGTLSLKAALEELGFSPCHHMIEAMKQADLGSITETLYHNPDDETALNSMLGGYKAVVDYPGCLFYKQLIKLNPEAKVILSVRESPELWEKSARATIFRAEDDRFANKPPFFKHLLDICAREHGMDVKDPASDLAVLYTEWNARVQRTVPNDKLLVFNVKEGWKPLCEFLGVPVPDKEFPKVNSTESFQKKYVTA